MKYTNVAIRFLSLTLVVMLVALAGCAKPPTKEMSDARMAFQAAGDAEAQRYAGDQYMSAEEALNEATALMEAKKYKQAREKAVEALKLAREAQASAVTQKNAMNMSAKDMYAMALEAVNAANRAGAYTYAPQLMEDAQKTLEEAKSTYEAGDYIAARQLAEAALSKAQQAEEEARRVEAAKKAEMQARAQQFAKEIADPGATPRPYPTNHIVIKGETLWWIAEYKQIYDDPFQWPLIYKANRSKIKDPDLIFPDQNFTIPRTPEVTDEMIKEAIKFAKNRGAWSLYDGK
jgi:nucleoid-associated protein YgaU